MISYSTPSIRSSTAGTTRPPIPFAVSATTRIGPMLSTSTNVSTCSTNSSSIERSERVPRSLTASGPFPSSTDWATRFTSSSPVSAPTGRAPDRHSLIPLYPAGLCDAVNIAPGMSRVPDAKYMRSVEASPTSMTSSPCSISPRANPATNPGPEGRMSRAITTLVAPCELTKEAKPTPSACAMSALSSSCTVPRMSYALTIWSRTDMTSARLAPPPAGGMRLS